MRFGLYMPNFGKSADPKNFVHAVVEAEKAGWDGVFLWDHLLEWDRPVLAFDSFSLLAAATQITNKIHLGTAVTPLPKIKPWLAAKQLATLDHLSNGRMILGVGLGGKESVDYARFGEPEENRVLGERLDEALDIITGLWSGKAFAYQGKHYRISKPTRLLPTPIQRPRIPIWCGGILPAHRPFIRAAKWDGVIPLGTLSSGNPGVPTTKDVGTVKNIIDEHRKSQQPFEYAIIRFTSTPRATRRKLEEIRQTAATWWLESLFTKKDNPHKMIQFVEKGPPN